MLINTIANLLSLLKKLRRLQFVPINDTVVAGKDADFGLSDNLLTSSDGMSLELSGIHVANLTGGTGNNSFAITGWTGTGKLTGAGGTEDRLVYQRNADIVLSNTTLADNLGLRIDLATIEIADLGGGASNNNFNLSGWTGNGSIDGALGSDSLTIVGNLNFALSDISLSIGTKAVALNSLEVAELTGGASANTFIVSGWTGTGTLMSGGGNDKLIAAKMGTVVLRDNRLSSADGMDVALSGINTANLSGSVANDTFDLSQWTGGGSVQGGGIDDYDTILTRASGATTLSNALLLRAGLPNIVLAELEAAQLYGGIGDDTFTVSGWTGAGYLVGEEGFNTVVASKNVDFTLKNDELTTSEGMSLQLLGISQANLTGGNGNNSFLVTGWTGSATLVGAGGVGDRVEIQSDEDIQLSNTSLVHGSGRVLTLASIEVATMTGNQSDNHFDLTGWTGTGSIAGLGGSDRVTSNANTNYVLTDSSLLIGTKLIELSSVESAELSGGSSANTFNVSGWTGMGTLVGGGGGDLVSVSKSGLIALSDSQIHSDDGMNLSLSGLTNANLSGGDGNDTFAVSGWTGGGKLFGNGTNDLDRIIAQADGLLVLSNTALARSGLPTLTLTSVEAANLAGSAGDDSFNVSGWTGSGRVNGASGTNTLIASKNSDFTLNDVLISSSDGMSLDLSDILSVHLTGGIANNTFDISGWYGSGTLTGGGGTADKIVYAGGGNFRLSNTHLSDTLGPSLSIATIEVAELSGNADVNNFDITDWTGSGSIAGGAERDTVIAAGNVNYTLANTSLTLGSKVINLSGVEVAHLMGGGSANTFSVSDWTGWGSLSGGGGNDVVNVAKNSNFTLSDSELLSTDGMSLTLVGIGTANLAGGLGQNQFDVSGWNGRGSIAGVSALDVDMVLDTVIMIRDGNFKVSDTLLSVATASSTTTISLTGIDYAYLAGGSGNNSFMLDDWTGRGVLHGGGGVNSLAIDRNVDMQLSDYVITASDGMSMDLILIGLADLTGGVGNNVLDASLFTGNATLDGDAGDDILFGGVGNGKLFGGAGNDILIGNAGSDILAGQAGRDLLIGGFGEDSLDGGIDEDILIGASTVYGNNEQALIAIMAEWSSTNLLYSERISNIALLLGGSSLIDDENLDVIKGGRNLDWFLAALTDDLITDLNRGGAETVS